jgi:hypothetical protein
MAEPVTFHSPYIRLSIQVKPERKGFYGEQPFIIPAVIAQFDNGNYTTADQDIIEALRKSPAYKRHEVFEINAETPKPPNPDAQKVFRGPVGTDQLHGEIGKQTQKQPGSKCEVCNKEFPNDLGGKGLKMHMVGHRLQESNRAKKEGVSVEEKTE